MASKKITAITLENYRAFYGKYGQFQMPKGENVFIYGENGSGKSSLFEGMKQFFAASRRGFDTATLEENIWHSKERNGEAPAKPSELKITCTFSDFDNGQAVAAAVPDVVELTHAKHIAPKKGPSNAAYPYILNAQLVSAFLSYKDLLPVYSPTEGNERKDIFGLMMEILKRLTNPSDPKATIGDCYDWLVEVCRSKRNLKAYRDVGIAELLTSFNSGFNQLLRDLDEKGSLNTILQQAEYFGYRMKINFDAFAGLNFNPRYRLEHRLRVPNLFCDVVFEDESLESNNRRFHNFLNEARLSGLAIAMFLAAARANPAETPYKILFLDDVFIGLDMSNRLPLLRVINDLFPDYQVFVATYDRHWFNVAKKRLEDWGGNWKFFEMYEGEGEMGGGRKIPIPIVKESESNLARAHWHFRHDASPDYPAAVNYLRKHAEEIIQEYLPVKELKNDSGEPEHWMLKGLLQQAKDFFNRINQDNKWLVELRGKLRTLLNPLSHFEVDTPAYKREVQEIFAIVDGLEKQLVWLRDGRYKQILPQASWVRINFTISSTETGHYELKTKDDLYVFKDRGSNQVRLSLCGFHVVKCYTVNNGMKSKETNLPTAGTYTSLENAYEEIYKYSIAHGYPGLVRATDYLDAYEYKDAAGNWVGLKGEVRI